MLKIEKIIKQLTDDAKPFKKISSFSDEPGIYALFFHGRDFPLDNYQPKVNEILYIGKTESSQKKRDADTHFKTGKTGSSTLRKTFGALLMQQYNLIPIPRSQSDIDRRRTAHFRFDTASENHLTQWMIENLGLSFYPYPKPVTEIDTLETELISALIPVLNIDRKNTANPFYNQIRSLRKQCSIIAYNTDLSSLTATLKPPTKSKQTIDLSLSKSSHISKYQDIWMSLLPSIMDSLSNNSSAYLQLNKGMFALVGNRKAYSFNLEFTNGKVSNNISGSAVARDLVRVLDNNDQFKAFAKGKYLKFKMNKSFILEVISK